MTWRLKRTAQCAKCPWIVGADPREIPDGYDEDAHRALACTIAAPGSVQSSGRAMACPESPQGDEAHCVGWLVNQLGPGNNIGLRLNMIRCENADKIRTRGEQHQRFEDTLP